MKKYFFSIIPLVIILLLVIYLFGNTLFPPKGKIIDGGDIYNAYFFWKSFLSENIRNGIIPFWNPYNFSGTPFFAHPDINLFYPLNWIYVIFPLNQSFSLYFFFNMLIASVTMYWLGKQFTNIWGATATAIIYVLGGYFAARIYSGHLEYIDAAAWVPLTFGMGIRLIEEPGNKNLVKFSISLTLLILSGNELFFLFTMEMLFLYLIFFLVINYKKKRLLLNLIRIIQSYFISGLLAFGIVAVQFLPRWQFISLSLRSQGLPYGPAGAGSLPFEGLKLFINPFYWGSPFPENYSYRGPWPGLIEFYHYVGLLTIFVILGFILVTIVYRIINSKTITIHNNFWFHLLFIIPIFLLISFGIYLKPNLHELLWQYVPFYKGLRIPARHLFVVAFSLSILGGMVIGNIKHTLIKVMLITGIVIDLLYYNKPFIRLTDIPTKTFDQKLISSLQNDRDLFRILPDYAVISSVRRDLDFGAATMYGIQMTSDYNSMVLNDYYHFIDVLNKSPVSSVAYYNVEIPPPNPYSPLIDFLNIKYLLSDKSFDLVASSSKSDKYKLILEGDRYRLYQNKNWLPRFQLLTDYQVYKDKQSISDKLRLDPPELNKSVLLLDGDIKNNLPRVEKCDKKEVGNIQVDSYGINNIILTINSFCDSFLSTSEVYYPGWKARIDNLETKIYPSNSSFRSIFIPKGNHLVEFYYFPKVYYIGLLISVISLLALIILIYKNKRKIVRR